MRRTFLALLALPATLAAQTAPLPPVAEQMAAAVLPLPAAMRADAKVLGFKTAGKLEVLREGKNGMTCLALYVTPQYVTRASFHVACYHDGLEAFMARGRELRAQGITRLASVDSARFEEVKSGKLKMPSYGALYSLTGPSTGWDPVANKATGASPLMVLYMPFATTATTGVSEQSVANSPWLMNAGTVKAHLMMVGTMGQ